MNNGTQLAFAQLTQTDRLAVQLIKPATDPTIIRILWPSQPTIVDARQFQETAAVLTKLFAAASTELSRLRATSRDLL